MNVKTWPRCKRGALWGARVFLMICAPVMLWFILREFDVFGPELNSSLSLVFGVLIFVLALPLSLFFPLLELAALDKYLFLLSGLGLAFLNLVLWGAFLGWRKRTRRLNADKTSAKVEDSKDA